MVFSIRLTKENIRNYTTRMQRNICIAFTEVCKKLLVKYFQLNSLAIPIQNWNCFYSASVIDDKMAICFQA